MLSRRYTLSLTALLPLAFARCANMTTPTVTLDQAKLYANDLILALSAAADTYVTSPGAKNIPLVLEIESDLQQLKSAIDSVESVADARSIVLQAIAFCQQLTPIVLPFLGPAAAAVPLALAVLQAFVQALPPPPEAPPTPPAALHAKALQYRPKHR